MPLLVTKYAEGNPVGFFREFLQATVVSHGTLFAQLTAFGEAAVGLGLVFGCLTTLASAIGLFLVVNYGLAVQWQGSSQQGFHYMLITTLVVLLAVRAGRRWGVDGWVRTHHPGSWLARLPLGSGRYSNTFGRSPTGLAMINLRMSAPATDTVFARPSHVKCRWTTG